MARNFKDLSEQEILALAIALEEEDGRIYGDVAQGLRLAQAWCEECHAVGAKTVGPGRAGPDFRDIANRAKTTALSLNVFLRSNHDNMPNFIIPRGETDDIVAYILSLKGR